MSCAVVFVCNFRYLDKFVSTCSNLIEIGDYRGPIVLVVGDDLPTVDSHPFILEHARQIQVRHCPDITFSQDAYAEIQKTNIACGKSGFKLFQYHKFHIFTPFFKQWERFYVDCGAKVYAPIAPIWRPVDPANDCALGRISRIPVEPQSPFSGKAASETGPRNLVESVCRLFPIHHYVI